MGMEKPPSKEELLLEWFLGDSKEILSELKATMETAQEVQKAMLDAGTGIGVQVDEARTELVTAYRELAAANREAEARQRSLMQSMESRAMQLLSSTQRRTVMVAATFAVLGGLIGGVGSALVLLGALGG